MNPHSITAHDFKLSLEAGIIERNEIIRWADGIIAVEEYNDDVANVCMASHGTDKELEALLAVIASSEEAWDGTRRMFGRMHDALLHNPTRLHDFTQFLERLWIRNDYNVPEDLSFVIGLEDAYQLAEQGQWGNLEEVRTNLMGSLVRFKARTEN